MLTSNLSLQFRYAHADDVEVLAKVYEKAELHSKKKPLSEVDIRGKNFTLRSSLQEYGCSSTLVALKDGIPVGYLMQKPSEIYNDRIEIKEFYVAEPNQGIGSYLISKLCKLQQSPKTINLVPTEEARDFYLKRGFENNGTHMTLDINRMDLYRKNITHQIPTFDISKYNPLDLAY